MTPFLIAHKVRGEAAFDIAERMRCPECSIDDRSAGTWVNGCAECDGRGFWWICSTSGARAYPYWHLDVDELMFGDRFDPSMVTYKVPAMPPSLPDHFPINDHKPSSKLSRSESETFLSELGL